jgi:acetylglutamate kinase
MTIVVKVGGQAVEEPGQRRAVAKQIAALCRADHRVVVVHGGGKLLTHTLQRMGIRTHFHEGLRVTDAATRDVALMVLAGIVNKQWVAELQSQGQRALGLCGGDAGLVTARKLKARSNGGNLDLGFVGRPQEISRKVLDVAFRAGIVPVVASLALGPDGDYYNINADDLAAALAVELRAHRLLYLTESGGVWDAEKRLLPVVKLAQIPNLIRREIVRDGMIPKLRSCARTLRRHVGEIDILSPAVPKGLLRAVVSQEAVGTRIVK